ncbi:sulfonate transport system substrate-binding protein [Roseateles sp. YR242]|uniref:aliphatic sulfonate ABC transporter substrate-binding protein n=1 Tax=Roseateles sp. YR242 TaxID=1855305 RepID=UPI0008B4CD9A|nr:aliphatic sulfonate ABC transporter substrate-binding protein [Roseateles sp. YR242]SEL85082.1 sulfonate transport system substrate-binding protein [Roseateles sp. YR242]
MKRRHLLATLPAAAAALHGLPRALAADTGKVLRVGFQKGGLLLQVKARGVLEQRLAPLGWQVRWLEFPAGPQLLEAFNVNAIDIGTTGAPPPIFAQAAGTDFVYFAAEPGQPHSEAIIVKPESPLRSLADLKDRRIGLQKGSSSHYLLLAALGKAGLGWADVQPVFLAPADARAAFERGAIDAWVVWDPYLTFAQAATKSRVLVDFSAFAPVAPPWSFYEARKAFAAEQPALLRDHVVPVLAEAGAWANANPQAAAKLLAPLFGMDEALLLQLQQRVRFGARLLNDTIAADQQRVADAFASQRLIPKPIRVREAWAPVLYPAATKA